MNFVQSASDLSSNALREPSQRKKGLADKRLFVFLVALSFPVFLLVAAERRAASSINKEIAVQKKGLFTDAKEYAVATIALALSSQ